MPPQRVFLVLSVHARQGGQILFGTDVGYLPDFDHAIEYELMASAGLGWREILAALTVNPATRFGEAARRGSIASTSALGSEDVWGCPRTGPAFEVMEQGLPWLAARALDGADHGTAGACVTPRSSD